MAEESGSRAFASDGPDRANWPQSPSELVYDLDAVPELVRQKNHTIEAVVDRIIVRPQNAPRIAESIDGRGALPPRAAFPWGR